MSNVAKVVDSRSTSKHTHTQTHELCIHDNATECCRRRLFSACILWCWWCFVLLLLSLILTSSSIVFLRSHYFICICVRDIFVVMYRPGGQEELVVVAQLAITLAKTWSMSSNRIHGTLILYPTPHQTCTGYYGFVHLFLTRKSVSFRSNAYCTDWHGNESLIYLYYTIFRCNS